MINSHDNESISNTQIQIRPEDAMGHITNNNMLGDFCIFVDSKGYNLIGLYSIIEKPHRYANMFAEFFKNQTFYANECTNTVERAKAQQEILQDIFKEHIANEEYYSSLEDVNGPVCK